MAKLTYLQLTNRVLGRITQSTISDVTAATGQALIITQLINEAQNELFTEDNWYSLYSSRSIATVASTGTYAVASDFGRNISLTDETGNRLLIEDYGKAFDEVDPDNNQTGNPRFFCLQGSNYRLYPIPAGIYTLRDRYWHVPATLATNAATSDLPIETENCIIQWSLYRVLEYLNKFEAADRARLEYVNMLKKAKEMNNKMLNKMHVFSTASRRGMSDTTPAQFPSDYPDRG